MTAIPAIGVHLAQMVLALAIAPGLLGIARNITGRLSGRAGSRVSQHYRELWADVRQAPPADTSASALTRAAPYIAFAASMAAAALVPTVVGVPGLNPGADLIVVVALLLLARIAIATSGGTRAQAGARRVIGLAVIAGPAMLLAGLAVAIAAGSTNLASIAVYVETTPAHATAAPMLAAVAFAIATLVLTARSMREDAHPEFTGIEDAVMLTLSGRDLAAVRATTALHVTVYASLAICLFVPAGMASGTSVAAVTMAKAAYGAKVLLAMAALALGAAVLTRLRPARWPWVAIAAALLAVASLIAALMERA